MNIVHVIESGGGSTEFVLLLIKHLPDHRHIVIHGERTFDLTSRPKTTDLPNATFILWKYATRTFSPWKDLRALWFLRSLLKSFDKDAVHLHSSKAGFLGRIACFLIGLKNVFYTPNGWSFIRKDISSLSRGIYLSLEFFASRLCGTIICCSESESIAFSKYGRTRYINNGAMVFDNHRKEASDTEKVIVSTSGRITNQKGPELFNKIALSLEKDSRFTFRWIGYGELSDLLTAKNIEVTGWLEKPAVIKELADADIYLSTAYWEGLPFAVLEAMNMSLPLVLNHCIGNVDLVRNDLNGYIFSSPEEACERLLSLGSSSALRAELGRNSRKLLREEFNAADMARAYELAYMG